MHQNACGVRDLLVCPTCRSAITFGCERIYCTSESCDRTKAGFPWIDGVPALIDFDRSIIAEDALLAMEGRSSVERGGLLWQKLSYILRDAAGFQGGLDQRASLFLNVLRKRSDVLPTVLNLGGASLSPNSPLRGATEVRLVASDIYNAGSTHVLADGHFLPFHDASFDGVMAQAVLEHVLDPAIVVAEIHRVLKPGGIVYAETSFMEQVHEGAFDFTRFTHSGHRWLFRNFDEIQSGASSGPGAVFLWSIRYLVRGLARTKLAGIAAQIIMLWVRLFDKLIPESFCIDSSSGVYFIGRKSKVALKPKDMIIYYRGAGRR